MRNVANLSPNEKNELFSETARMMQTTEAIVEKDFWVVWTLDRLFADDRLNTILMFKGGTSLSKVFNLIGRFSEDIDLILDWNLVTDEDPFADRGSNTQQNNFNVEVNEKAKQYIQEILLPIISEVVGSQCSCEYDEDERGNYFVNINYPFAFSDAALRPQILLEIGPLASWLPSNSYTITPFAAEQFPGVFTQPTCNVNAVMAKRTFWEKATILHQEANRAEGKFIV